MGQFQISISGLGMHGCDRRASAGEKLYGRCARMDCVDCLTLDFLQNLRQKGLTLTEAKFVHRAAFNSTEQPVVDNLLTNTREQGKF